MIIFNKTNIIYTCILVSILPIIYQLSNSNSRFWNLQYFNKFPISNQGHLVRFEETKEYSTIIEESRENACFVILIRNQELADWLITMQELEDRFNNKFNYPYVFLNDVPFTDSFMENVRSLTDSKVEFGIIPKEHWSVPSFIDQEKALKSREKMANDGIIYGGSLPYRHMCRFESGFFFRHNLTMKYDYYWRVEPGVSFSCDINYDPFKYMRENNKLYSFTITIHEFEQTIPSLWNTVTNYLDLPGIRESLPKDNAMGFVSDDKGATYNGCHFWSNFEIASFDLWRSPDYIKFFNYLDQSGGFFYERWGDAPVHSIFASLFLPKEKIHFFDNIGYYHSPYSHCPTNQKGLSCHCDPSESFDMDPYSCTWKWLGKSPKWY